MIHGRGFDRSRVVLLGNPIVAAALSIPAGGAARAAPLTGPVLDAGQVVVVEDVSINGGLERRAESVPSGPRTTCCWRPATSPADGGTYASGSESPARPRSISCAAVPEDRFSPPSG